MKSSPGRRWPGAILAAFLLACVCGFGPPTLGDGDPFAPRIGLSDLVALQAIPNVPTSVRATAAITVDGTDGHVLAARNADERRAPASLTKMMTALVALDHASLSDSILATERSRTEPVVIGLDPGDTLSLEDMLFGLLLPSGNDAALAIAETVGGGSIDRFVGWMNQRAVAMGLANTHFANPHGLDQDGHYSSARDLAEMARAVMAEPTLARIVGTRRYVVEGPPLYLFVASNPILGAYPGADGIKTGFTDDAGRCFAGSATRDGRRVITVLLNSPNIGAEAQVLLDAGFASTRPLALDVPRAGFAGVRDLGAPTIGGMLLNVAGWESPFLRAFTSGNEPGKRATTISLLGHPLARWTS